MTITMSLEIESGISMNEIAWVLSEVGAELCTDSDGVSGNFDVSNTYFVFRESHGLGEVVTEGVNVSWVVGIRGAFHCPVDSLAESSDDINRFLNVLSDKKNVALSLPSSMKVYMQSGMKVDFVS